MLFQPRLDCWHAITQVLASDVAGNFLSTRETDHLWNFSAHEQDAREYSSKPGICKWLRHDCSEQQVIRFEGAAARICSWSDWTEGAIIDINLDLGGLEINNAFPCPFGTRQRTVLKLSEVNGSA